MKVSRKELRNYAMSYLANKLPRWSWLREDVKLMTQIIEMAEKIRGRKQRRGQTKVKRTFPNREYHFKQDNKTCSFCYPDSASYAYKNHGRISHKDLAEVHKVPELMGESADGSLILDPNCTCDACWQVPGAQREELDESA